MFFPVLCLFFCAGALFCLISLFFVWGSDIDWVCSFFLLVPQVPVQWKLIKVCFWYGIHHTRKKSQYARTCTKMYKNNKRELELWISTLFLILWTFVMLLYERSLSLLEYRNHSVFLIIYKKQYHYKQHSWAETEQGSSVQGWYAQWNVDVIEICFSFKARSGFGTYFAAQRFSWNFLLQYDFMNTIQAIGLYLVL